MLFPVILERVFRSINHHGGTTNDDELLTHLSHDYILVATNPQDVQHDLRQVANLSKEKALETNLSEIK